MSRQNSRNKQYTYFVKSKYFPESFIDEQFKARGNWIKYDVPLHRKKGPIDFIYLDELFYTNPRYYSFPAKLKNTVNDDKRQISFKHNLVRNLLGDANGSKYVMPQYELDLYTIQKENVCTGIESPAQCNATGVTHPVNVSGILVELTNKFKKLFTGKTVYIFKPVTGMGGSDIGIFDKFSDFKRYVNNVIIRNGKLWGKVNPDKEPLRRWVLQEYITNPLLIEKEDTGSHKYKFHIRQAYLYQPLPKQSYYRPLNMCPIAIAEKPYIHGDWSNKDIHDTHFHGKIDYDWYSSLKLIPTLKNNLEAIRRIDSQLHELYTIIDKNYIKAQCYPETKHCFELFGCDIMITDTFEVKVIEINAGMGISGDISIKRDIFDTVMINVVDMYYPPKNKVPIPTKLFTPITRKLRKSGFSKRVIVKAQNKRIGVIQTKKVNGQTQK
jgi:hypothetical protein